MAEARIKDEDEIPAEDSVRSTGTGGGAGAAPAGGMPDLAGLLNNPAMMQMAQQLMQNGGLEGLMSNPSVANMVCRLMSLSLY